MIAGLVFVAGLSSARAEDAHKAAVRSLEDRITEINESTKKPEQMKTAMQKISTETGVPLERVHNMHKSHENAGAGGLMIACVLAKQTNDKKSAVEFLDKHATGKSWEEIAKDNHVSLDTLTSQLDTLQADLKK
jgi:hypothetical protein